ncbi:MAG TPA: GNAT family N-acetyltransferase, partial [Polyangia bacterium]|nr:GNAT family N-acetyltransferase [Polyangia bacterium]
PLGVVVADDGVLLGRFIALLAVRAEASGQGLGRRLVEHVGALTAATRRWLYTSADGNNAAALRFYRKLGFSRVGRLPDLIRPGRIEILLRRPAPPPDTRRTRTRPAKIPTRPPRVGYHQGAS